MKLIPLHKRKRFRQLQPVFKLLLFILFLRSISYATETGNLIAVIDLASDGTVSTSTIDSVCEVIYQTIVSDKRYEVFDRRFLPFSFQSLGLSGRSSCFEASCLMDLGAAIGSRYVIGGSIQKVKKGFLIRLTLVNSESKEHVGTISKMVKTSTGTTLNQMFLPIVNELLVLNKSQKRPQTAVYATLNKPPTSDSLHSLADATDNRQTTKLVSVEKPKTIDMKHTQPRKQQMITNTNKKPRLESKESSAAVNKKKEKSNSLPVLIGTSAVVVGAAAAVYYFKFIGSSSSGDDDFLSLDDAPIHGR